MACLKKLFIRETLQVNGASAYIGGVTYSGAVTMASTLDVTGAATVGGTLGVTGALNAASGSKIGSYYISDGAGADAGYAKFGTTAGAGDGGLFGKSLILVDTSAADNTVNNTIKIKRMTTAVGHGAAGLGTNIDFAQENDAGAETIMSEIQSATKTAASGAEDNYLYIKNTANGSLATVISIDGRTVTFPYDVVFNGPTTTISSTNVLVEDKLITLNDGGLAGSGAGVGIEVEEDGSATGYAKVNAGRTGWEFMAPAGTATASILPSGTSALDDLTCGTTPHPGAIQGNMKLQFAMLNPTVNTVAAFEESGNAIGTWAASGANFLVTSAAAPNGGRGSANSLHFACLGAAADGDYCADARASVNWGGADMVGMWIYSTTGLAAGDVNFYLLNGTGGGHKAINELDLGVVAANTWTYLRLDISAWTAATTTDDVEAIGFMLTAQGAAKTIAFDVNNISRWDETNTTALPQQVLYGSIHGAYYFGDVAANDYTVVPATENTHYIINYNATGNEFISLTDLSGQIVFMTYSYV